mgnify:CR=1 FL=1
MLYSDLVLGIFSGDRNRFIEYNEMVNEDSFIDDDVVKARLTDEEAREEISRVIDRLEIAQIKSLPSGDKGTGLLTTPLVYSVLY